MRSIVTYFIAGALITTSIAGCCKSQPTSKDDYRRAAEICVDICPGDPAGSDTDKAMNKGCREGCIEDCEKNHPGACKDLLTK